MVSVFYEQRSENLFIGPICDHPFPAHIHDAVEIVFILKGNVEMTIAGERYRLGPGDLLAAFPSIPHSYEYVAEDAEGITLIFLADAISEFSNTFRTNIPVSPLLTESERGPELAEIVGGMKQFSAQANSPLRLGYLHLFLSYLFLQLPLQPLKKHMQSGLAYQVLHYISEHYTEPLSLESTARELGISRTHLSHIFSQQLHINFRKHINTLRINLACSLLADPFYSISQIAYLCGYGNPRTFHRAFLTQCSMAPNQYRATLFGHDCDELPFISREYSMGNPLTPTEKNMPAM